MWQSSTGSSPGVGAYPLARQRIDVRGKTGCAVVYRRPRPPRKLARWITEFARAAVAHGTGAVVTDPHEIANVAGLPGVAAVRAAAVGLPLRVAWTVPSCVPASVHESPGAVFGLDDIGKCWPGLRPLGLAN
jgi:adenine deaminase